MCSFNDYNCARKFYDLAERHLDPALLAAENPCPDDDALLCWRVSRRVGAVGLLWDKSSPAFLGLELNAERRRRALSRLEADGTVLPATVEGLKPTFYFLAADEPLMQAVLVGTLDRRPRMELLAPLDPLFWNRSADGSLPGYWRHSA